MKHVYLLAVPAVLMACVVQTEPIPGDRGPQGPQGSPGEPGGDANEYWTECASGICYGGTQLGVGTDQPSAAFHVVDFDGTKPSSVLFESGGTLESTFRFEIPTPTYGGSSSAISIAAGGPAGQAYSFLRALSDGVGDQGIPRFEIYSSGSMGVGLNFAGPTPIFKTFDTAHDPSNVPSDLCVGLDDGGGAVGMCIRDSRNSENTFNDQHLVFTTHKGGVGAGTRMVITPLGEVGIGTTEPTALLHVSSESSGPAAQFSNTGTGYALAVGSNGIVTAGNAILGTDSAARVGVRTTTPKATLDVNGTARLAKFSVEPHACTQEYDGTIALTGKYTMCVCKASSWVQTSDGMAPCVW